MRPELYYSRYERAAKENGCYTVVQMARLVGVTHETVVNWCEAEKIACVRWEPHRWRMIPRSELARAVTLMNQQRTGRRRVWDRAATPKTERSMKVEAR